jgi:hypothetical protein
MTRDQAIRWAERLGAEGMGAGDVPGLLRIVPDAGIAALDPEGIRFLPQGRVPVVEWVAHPGVGGTRLLRF